MSWSWSLKSAVVHRRELKNSMNCSVHSGLTWKRVFQPQIGVSLPQELTSQIKRLHKFVSRPNCHLQANYDCMYNLCFAFKLNFIQPAWQVLTRYLCSLVKKIISIRRCSVKWFSCWNNFHGQFLQLKFRVWCFQASWWVTLQPRSGTFACTKQSFLPPAGVSENYLNCKL